MTVLIKLIVAVDQIKGICSEQIIGDCWDQINCDWKNQINSDLKKQKQKIGHRTWGDQTAK